MIDARYVYWIATIVVFVGCERSEPEDLVVTHRSAPIVASSPPAPPSAPAADPEGDQSLRRYHAVPPSVRESYEADEWYPGQDGWVQGYERKREDCRGAPPWDAPRLDLLTKCQRLGCDLWPLRWAWEDPRADAHRSPSSLRYCKCDGVTWLDCVYWND